MFWFIGKWDIFIPRNFFLASTSASISVKSARPLRLQSIEKRIFRSSSWKDNLFGKICYMPAFKRHRIEYFSQVLLKSPQPFKHYTLYRYRFFGHPPSWNESDMTNYDNDFYNIRSMVSEKSLEHADFFFKNIISNFDW